MKERSDEMENTSPSDCSEEQLVRCPVCAHDWPTGCEQAVAIRKRGKCIVCLVARGEHFSMDPYEFPSDPGYTPNAAHDGRRTKED